MKKLLLFIFSVLLFVAQAVAEECFLAKENDRILQEIGDCNKRYAPCSTFKIALSLIGYDSKILIDEIHPLLPFKKTYPDFLDSWKQDQSPKSWIKNSCVWYSQILTKKLGIDKFQLYITKFNYGNMDLSGDLGKNNGVTNSWLSSSLEISSLEQISFLEKLITNKLSVTRYAHEMTKNILFIENFYDGWKLYGKTGSGVLLNQDRTIKLKIQHGWFIGWIEKNGKIIIFSNHMTDNKLEDSFASQRARADAKKRLIILINQLR